MLLVRGGMQPAFDVLVRRYQSRALQVAIRQLGSPSLAEDAVQEAFVELYRYVPRYRPEGKLRPLLFRIVTNRARMARRSWKRARLLLQAPPERSVEPVAEAQILAQEYRREIIRAMSTLPERYRSVVTLRFGADLDYAEISETLQIPVGTVKSRMFTALGKLRKKLKGVDLG